MSELNYNSIILSDNDIIQLSRNIYYIPYDDTTTIVFAPEAGAVVHADPNTKRLIELCSMPMTYCVLKSSFNVSENDIELSSMLKKLLFSGILLHNGSTMLNRENNQTKHDDSTYTDIPLPKSATLHVTNRCNLNCSYCYNRATRETSLSEEISINQWRKILKDLFQCGVTNITVSGGEPLLRTDLIPLFHDYRLRGMNIQIITNATLLNISNIKDINNAFNTIIISCDSHIPEINDMTRGINTSQRIYAAIELLDKHDISFNINTVLTRYNIDYYIDTRAYFLGIESCKSVKPIVYERTTINDEMCPSYSQLDRYYFELYNDIDSKEGLSSISSDLRQGLILPRSGCGTGRVECSVGPDGSLYPCRALYFDEFNAGNLLENQLECLWANSSILNSVRHADAHREAVCRDSNCDLFSYCLGGCFGHTFAAIKQLKPWATAFDCNRIKLQTRHMLAATTKVALRGESLLETL